MNEEKDNAKKKLKKITKKTKKKTINVRAIKGKMENRDKSILE